MKFYGTKLHTIKPCVLEVARLFVGFWEFFSFWLLRNSSSRCRADSIIDFSTRVSPELSNFHRKTNDLVSRIDKINKFGDTNDRNKFQRSLLLTHVVNAKHSSMPLLLYNSRFTWFAWIPRSFSWIFHEFSVRILEKLIYWLSSKTIKIECWHITSEISIMTFHRNFGKMQNWKLEMILQNFS